MLTSNFFSVAKDKIWFDDDYVAVDCRVFGHLGDLGARVVGYGSVTIPVKTSLNNKGPSSQGTLRVSDVLHVPEMDWNIIGQPALDAFSFSMPSRTEKSKGKLTTPDGKCAALVKYGPGSFSNLPVLRLSGYPVGPKTALPKEFQGEIVASVNWPQAEKDRCARQVRRQERKANPPLTSYEKVWLRKEGGTEFKFLTQHGLNIYNQEDRHKGHALLRGYIDHVHASIRGDAKESDLSKNIFSSEHGEERKQKLHETFLSQEKRHRADASFDPDVLEHINSIWGCSSAFMYHFGLDPDSQVDVDKACEMADKISQLYETELSTNEEIGRDSETLNALDHHFGIKGLYEIKLIHGNVQSFFDDLAMDPTDESDLKEAKEALEYGLGDGDDSDDDNDLEDAMEEEEGKSSLMWNYMHTDAPQFSPGPRQLANHFLSEEELAFVEKIYGDSISFMICHQLRFYRQKDCMEASSIIAKLMSEQQ